MKVKNILVMYHGGGADGNFWEWNFFAFDKDGGFHNLFASGRMGIRTLEQAMLIMARAPAKKWNCGDVYIYDLDKEADIEDFQDSYAVPAVVQIVKSLNSGKHGEYPEMWFKCDECDEKSDTGHMEDWHGCGGIASTADTKLCEDCYDAGCCTECGDYDTTVKDHDGICDTCYQSSLESILESLDGDGCKVLEYNRLSNTLTEVAVEDSSLTESGIKGASDPYWMITVHCKDEIKKYIIDSPTETTAISDVVTHLGGSNSYFTADAELLANAVC